MTTIHRLSIVLAASLLAACTGTVTTGGGGAARPYQPPPDRPPPRAENPPPRPDRPPPPPASPEWNSTGWTLLGTQVVEGSRDRDVFVPRKGQRLDRLTMVVKGSDLEMIDFVVTFQNGEKWEPKLRHFFRENTRTRAIDIPGADRLIKRIDVKYSNVPGGGKATVEVWGKDVRDEGGGPPPPPPPDRPPPPPPVEWNSTGWTMLGSQVVEGKRDRDVFVPRKGQRFDRLTMVVKGSDLELIDFVVTFGNGEKWEPKLRHTFREGSRTHAIDVPGADRQIKRIDVKYSNLPGGGKATVEVWGKDVKGEGNPGLGNKDDKPGKGKDKDKDDKPGKGKGKGGY